MREDLVDLAKYATSKGMRAVISTNGTLITKKKARNSRKSACPTWASPWTAPRQSTTSSAACPARTRRALQGVENCQAEGLKVGLRFTINKRNAMEIPHLFDLIETMEIPRICFYHLVYSGRGSELIKEDLNHQETRETVDLIMDRTRALFDKGLPKEVLTVDNHADGPYVYYRMLKEDPQRAATIPLVRSKVDSLSTTLPGPARALRREATFTVSPMTVYSMRTSLPMLPETTSPVFTEAPTRPSTGLVPALACSASSLCMSQQARTALTLWSPS